MTALQRGRVYGAILDEQVGRKPYLVVSNNRRNRNLSSILAVRITTSPKPDIPSVVTLGQGDPLVGSVLFDEVGPLWEDEVQADAGALSGHHARRRSRPARCPRADEVSGTSATHAGV